MWISKCLKRYLPEIRYSVVDERSIDSLGLINSTCDKSLCSFVDDEKYLTSISNNIHMLLITKELLKSIQLKNVGYIIVDNPRQVFFQLHNKLQCNKEYIRTSFDTEIASTAKISEFVSISNKNVKIGENVVIEPFVTIYENTIIEDGCIIRSGARIGGTGFEQKRKENEMFLVEHLGGTILHHNVEVQNNTCIDRAIYPWDNTIIGEYTKMDNLVHIGHAVKIGSHCLITAQVVFAGRVNVKNDVWIGPGAIIRNGISIGKGARVNMGSVVTKDVPENGSVTGNFAIPHEIFMDNLKNSVKK